MGHRTTTEEEGKGLDGRTAAKNLAALRGGEGVGLGVCLQRKWHN